MNLKKGESVHVWLVQCQIMANYKVLVILIYLGYSDCSTCQKRYYRYYQYQTPTKIIGPYQYQEITKQDKIMLFQRWKGLLSIYCMQRSMISIVYNQYRNTDPRIIQFASVYKTDIGRIWDHMQVPTAAAGHYTERPHLIVDQV